MRKSIYLSKPKKKKKLRQYLPYFNLLIEGGICIILPIHVASEANSNEHWSEKNRRHQNQKEWINTALYNHKIFLPCEVKLIRLAPRKLDVDDNLPMSFKYIKDYIAAQILQDFVPGRADSNPNIRWSYSQQKSSLYGAKVLILFSKLPQATHYDESNQFDLAI